MPELPEVEFTARLLDRALAGAEIESALAPGINALKTVDPPLSSLAGRHIERVRRRGKHLIVQVSGGLALLIHLMSAGRLQLYDRRAGPRDRTSRLLVRLCDGRELRLREFGSKQAAWVKLLRDQHTIAGIGRSWVDEILWSAMLSPFKRGEDLDEEERERLAEAIVATIERALAHYEQAVQLPIPDKLPMPLQVHRHEGQQCPRCASTLKSVHFEDYVIAYCPACQTEGRTLKDRRLSRLLR